MRPPSFVPCPCVRLGVLVAASFLATFPLYAAEVPSPDDGPRVLVRYEAAAAEGPLDGRLLLLLSTDEEEEPRFQLRDDAATAQAFGLDVEDWEPGEPTAFDGSAFGYPIESLTDLPAGRYRVQALLNRYETFTRSDGHTVSLPPDRGEGQQWNQKPGNLLSEPRWVEIGPEGEPVTVVLDRTIPPVESPLAWMGPLPEHAKETGYGDEWIRHERLRSELLSEFWGTDVYLGAHVLLPKGWHEETDRRYPILIFHGHFPGDFGGWRPEPPDPDLECEYSERFDWPCYNRTVQEHAYAFHQAWTTGEIAPALIVEIQHPTPYYDDSYAVNSENNGPYGDALTRELIPYLEEKYRGIGEGWARFLYGGSTGGWEAMAAQVFYPEEYNGAWIACPDPIDFRAFTLVDLYEDENAYWIGGPFTRTPRAGHRNWLGQVDATLEAMNRRELVLGTKTRSGQQWDIWEAVYSPVGEDGYPRRIWDKETGAIDAEVAAHWRENYDLVHILRRDWATLGPKLRGKLHVYVGDMDNYYLNNAVYLAEEFLESTEDPPYEGEIAYGDRAEHCWNGDPTRPNATSRLRYHEMFVPRAVERMKATAPEGALERAGWE